jgi:hypothetical protein
MKETPEPAAGGFASSDSRLVLASERVHNRCPSLYISFLDFLGELFCLQF